MFLFDTDHLTFLQRRQGPEFERILERVAQHDQSEFFVSIISFHEQALGWHNYIAKTKQVGDMVIGYRRFEDLLIEFGRYQVRSFHTAAADVYEELRSRRVRVGAMDLRIASIAIADGLTLLTRNSVDFQRVPNLTFEDWTQG